MTSTDGISPSFNRVQTALQRDVSAGTVSATDQTAITAALGDIQAQLAAGATGSATTASAGAATNAPASMKDRVDAMIDNEVSTGKLTSDQAGELKTAFQQVHDHMHGAHGHHGGGAAGLLASLTTPSTTSADPAAASAGSSTDAAGNPLTTAATTAAAALEAFVAQFKSAAGSNGLYASTGAGSTSVTSLLVNAIG